MGESECQEQIERRKKKFWARLAAQREREKRDWPEPRKEIGLNSSRVSESSVKPHGKCDWNLRTFADEVLHVP